MNNVANRIFALGLLAALSGCAETPPKVTLRSLQGSGEATFVCRASDRTGRTLDSCPDFETEIVSERHHLFALVTQTNTGEVAVIDVSAGEVVDVAPSIPGYSFLRVGAQPGDIVTSPGGAASFVGAAEVGREGIYALPTTCLGPPTVRDGVLEPERDITTWPACALPAAPGDMAVLIDPPNADGSIDLACDGTEVQPAEPPIAAMRSECPADLTTEGGPPGRRKLAVALPDLGEIAIIDAQALLDRPPGSFAPCDIERRVPLAVDLPVTEIAQPVPADLQAPGCTPESQRFPPRPAVFTPRPGGFSLADGTLYVADLEAPVVHVLDVSDGCEPHERPPLLPVSFGAPDRVVTTSRVAVSPLTPSGNRFLYAIDRLDQPGASVMVFDVSPGSTNRTPLVRPGSVRLPFEAPDRIGFASSVRDVTFALRDLPVSDPVLGVAPVGTLCDPEPSSTGLGVAFRPNSDYTAGARPAVLRGVFGFALLTSGQIAVIDAEDFDAPCRRPISANPGPEEDFRGCANDPVGGESRIENYFTLDGEPNTRTVTNEVSCRVVEPHRTRAAGLAITDPAVGVRAPALRGLPLLNVPQSVGSRPAEERPRILAVDFPGVGGEAFVNIGSTLYRRATPEAPSPENPLNVDPNNPDPALLTQNSLTLPPAEPRSYPPSDSYTLTFEGRFAGPRPAGFLRFNEAGAPNTLRDDTVSFCALGVYDVEQMRAYGRDELLVSEGPGLDQFAVDHADYVQITGDFPDEDDSYWASASCSRLSCENTFGPFDADDLLPTRELRIREAFADRLVVEPRSGGQELIDALECCFPGGTEYVLRVSRQWALLSGGGTVFLHDIVAGQRLEADGTISRPCVRDCDPRKRLFKSRVFEISSSTDCEDEDDVCRVGLAQPGEVACVYDQLNERVGPDGAIPQCIFENLTSRFALYRGRCSEPDCSPSVRGMRFDWQTTGGFATLFMSLLTESTAVSPLSITFVPGFDWLAVIDGSSQGLALFSLDTLRLVEPSPFF